ncbi:hypothetical protein ALC57_12115 [Trachymyrmex cornetzi]|uniref:Uncharacterized protein n=1 Tax=Trachymyrmex cornetzi TaxID=471704 RepID=A0A195DS23_9HYME|nr:hypothetical protein ALC57_12115 [Trachymyrmex cornetzi]
MHVPHPRFKRVIIVPSGPGIGGWSRNNVIMVVRPRSFWFNTQHITGDSVGQIHSGYDGFFKLNKQTVPFTEISSKKESKVYLAIYRQKCFGSPFALTFLQLVTFCLSLLKILVGLFSSCLLSLVVPMGLSFPFPFRVVVEHSLPVDKIRKVFSWALSFLFHLPQVPAQLPTRVHVRPQLALLPFCLFLLLFLWNIHASFFLSQPEQACFSHWGYPMEKINNGLDHVM